MTGAMEERYPWIRARYEQPRWEPPTTLARTGDHGVNIPNAAEWLRCSRQVARDALGAPVGFSTTSYGTTYPLFSMGQLGEAWDDPRVVVSRTRISARVTPRSRMDALQWLVETNWVWSDPLLVGVQVVGYRSIEELTVPLGSLTVLFGPNGSGKTSILEAISSTFGDGEQRRRLRDGAVEEAAVRQSSCLLLYRLHPQDQRLAERVAEYLLLKTPASSDQVIERALADALARPVVAVSEDGSAGSLYCEESRSMMDRPVPSIPRDPWVSRALRSLSDARGGFRRMGTLPRPLDVTQPEVRILDVSPAGLAADVTRFVDQHLAADTPGHEDGTPTIEWDEFDPDSALWVRWSPIAGLAVSPEELLATSTRGPSGSSRTVIVGEGEVGPDHVLECALLDDSEAVERLVERARVQLAERLTLESALQYLTLRAAGAEAVVPSIGSPDAWIELDEGRLRPTRRVINILQALSNRANEIAPPFAKDLGRLFVFPTAIDSWESGPRVEIRFMSDSGHDLRLAEAGRGTERWVAASVRKALDELAAESEPPALLIVDEPESALHPTAQDQVAEWCSDTARRGVPVLVATHSPSFLDLPASVASVVSVTRREGVTTCSPLEVAALAGLDELAASLGLGRSGLLLAVRGFLLVEGPADVDVLRSLMGSDLRHHRIVPLPLHGAFETKGAVQSAILRAVNRPAAVMLDNVAREVVEGRRPPETSEEKVLMKVRAGEDGAKVHPISFEAPDIVCAIPEAAMRRVSERFTTWSDAFTSLGDGEGFKHRLLDSLQWRRKDDRLLISAGLEATDPSDPLPPAFLRTKAEILAWADGL